MSIRLNITLRYMGEILWPPTSAHHARRRFLRARSHFELAVGKPRRIGTALDLSVVFAVPARRTVARPTVALLLARCHFSGVRCRRGNLMLDSVQNLQVCGSRSRFPCRYLCLSAVELEDSE